ncbi:hypothetical protein Afil01_67880 [Actinorhabdospora filicis]|uniref:Uncharacterized protein n=1 Tax=Actinorhabdospora filicis TaxID=1785913 RepID=A0A9W6WDV3_9ACTN|nr:hypothetical protein [Actinorhabdospora filicis]GLZ81981.1 hypothetical protein Afil01_67880 [Actinorhabdospora filicis]
MVSNTLIERREAHDPALLTAIRKPLSQDAFACPANGDRGLSLWTGGKASVLPAVTEPMTTASERMERRLAPVFAGVQGTSVSIAGREIVAGTSGKRETGVFGTRVATGGFAPAHNYKSIVLAQRDPRGAKGDTGGLPPRRKPDEG